jgi:hypothetical protein
VFGNVVRHRWPPELAVKALGSFKLSAVAADEAVMSLEQYFFAHGSWYGHAEVRCLQETLPGQLFDIEDVVDDGGREA